MTWLSTHLPGYGPSGTSVFSVLAKRTYSIGQGSVEVAGKQNPLSEDAVFSDPADLLHSEVLAESDMVTFKPSTDVVIKGRACAPRGKQALVLECEARVGPLYKMVRVFGNRKIVKKALTGSSFSEPEPFSSIELSYTRTYGGIAISKNGTYLPYYLNPIGRGYALKGGVADITALEIPNQEDPESPLTPDTMIIDKPEDALNGPRPASFGWTRPDFYPRYTYVSGYPLFVAGAANAGSEGMGKQDVRFYQGASNGLWGKQLIGGEPVTLKYFDPDFPSIQFQLPAERPAMEADIGKGTQKIEPVLQTVVIDMALKKLSMLWRGSIQIENMLQLEHISSRVE